MVADIVSAEGLGDGSTPIQWENFVFSGATSRYGDGFGSWRTETVEV